MKSLDEYMAFYSESFIEPSGKLIQKACALLAFFAIFALLWSISFFLFLAAGIAAFGFYYSLSKKTALAGVLMIGIAWALQLIIGISPIFLVLLIVIAIGGQIYGQTTEGEKLNFVENVTFQLIGPLWALGPRNLRKFDLY